MVQVETDPVKQRPRGLRTLIRFLGWMIRIDPWRSVLSLFLEFTSGLLPAATVWVVRELFDQSVGVYEGRAPVKRRYGCFGSGRC